MKYRLRKWVVVLLIAINCILAMLISGEYENPKLETIATSGSFILMILNTCIFIKYGDLNRNDI